VEDKDDGLKLTNDNDDKMIFQYKQIRKFPAVEAGCFPPFARVTERSCGELWISEVKALNSPAPGSCWSQVVREMKSKLNGE